MNEKQVKQVIACIDSIKEDYEAAHYMEDNLYLDVLRHIAEGGENAQSIAKEALKSREIDFNRYTA
ncbi:hypothetical protein JTF06_12075 [Desemzia sp. RIT804]|uniref:hypothetical protein n=1 Tax=Desemzia sp. RIT 804 TaxID=2810209 RepID=UPI00194E781C|nr:hypothetical protein [Desemzia sp. RIT 804]MBM6615623.1 hypothetical protein [Desemzia sp. RIT 804]